MDQVIDALGINPKVLLVQIIAFLLIFWILKKFLFTRIQEYMKSRSEEIKNTFTKIEKDKEEIERLTKEYQQKLAEIEKTAYDKIQQAIKEGISAKSEILKEAHEQSQKTLEKARDEIEREKQKAILELRKEVITLSLEVAEKLIDAPIMDEQKRGLADKFLKEIENTRRS